MNTPGKKLAAVLFLATAFVGSALLPYYASDNDGVSSGLQVARPIPAFSLKGSQGETFTDRSLRGRPAYVYFGYAGCTIVCSAKWSIMAEAADALPDARFLFVTLAPEEDSLLELRERELHFQHRVIALTSGEHSTWQVAESFGVRNFDRSSRPDAHGDRQHPDILFHVSDEGEIVRVFFGQITANEIIAAHERTM